MIKNQFKLLKESSNVEWRCLLFFELNNYVDSKLMINTPNIIQTLINRINLINSGFILLNIVSSKTMIEINRDIYPFKKISDVLSIPLFDDTKELSFDNPIGEIYICYEKAIRQANKYNHSIEREFSFLFLHGLLHLLKFNHINKLDEEIMFRIQDFVLNKLGIIRKN